MTRHTEALLVLDIGSTCVRALIGRNTGDRLEVLSIAEVTPVRDAVHAAATPQEVARAIERAAEQAMLHANVRVNEAWVGMPSNWVVHKEGVGETRVEQRLVRRSDLARALENARHPHLSPTRKILHQYGVQVSVDGRRIDVLSTAESGERLRVNTQMAICPTRAITQLLDVVKMAGLQPRGIMLETLAAATATLTPAETHEGVLLMELGARKTSLGFWKNGQVRDLVTIETGGHSFAEELAMSLRIPTAAAVRVQETGSCVCHPNLGSLPFIDIPLDGGESRRVTPLAVAQILEPRVMELFEEINVAIAERGHTDHIHHVVLTGGGAWMRGFSELAEEFFEEKNWSVRLGLPRGAHSGAEQVSQTRYATVVGLLREASSENRSRTFYGTEEQGVRSQIMKGIARFFDTYF